MNKLVLQLPSGPCTIGTFENCFDIFVHQQINSGGEYIHFPVTNHSAFDTTDDISKVRIDRRTVKLNNIIYKTSAHEIHKNKLQVNSLTDEVCEIYLRPMLIKSCLQDMTSLIMKRQELFYKPTLEVDDIMNLAMDFYRNTGAECNYAFHFELNKYQKYFILLSSEAFKIFRSDFQKYRSGETDEICFHVKLKFEEMNPNYWVLGRYDESKYLESLMMSSRLAAIW